MAHVFISYSHTDREYARRLKEELENRGFDAWMDDYLGVGARWSATLAEKVRTSGALILLMSPEAEASEWVEREWQEALDKEIEVVPLLLRGNHFFAFRTRQCLDVSSGELPPESFYEQLGRILFPDVLDISRETLRDLELAYLDDLLERYEYWQDHYTPLAGIAEVRAAVQDGPRLDLPMPFLPREFEVLERSLGSRSEAKRERVDDLRVALAQHERVILLGDPGSGKTTTLWRLVYDAAQAAREDPERPLPVYVPLGGYSDDAPFEVYLARHFGPLAPYWETYLSTGRLLLLLDGLNEMPQLDYAERVVHIRKALGRWSVEKVVVTCRVLDYVEKLEGLTQVEVSPLDPLGIHAFVCSYLGLEAGERLAWELVGRREARRLCQTWQQTGRTWREFWTAEDMPRQVYVQTTGAQYELWRHLRQVPPPLISLCGNPYLLLMTAQVYAANQEALPGNRARLFGAFVETLLGRERNRQPQRWIPMQTVQEGIAGLAYAMQEAGERGTSVEQAWVLDQLRAAVPDCDPTRLLYLAASASLLDVDSTTVRFMHQLLQEYFAARGLWRRLAAGQDPSRHWSDRQWWDLSGWEETFILTAGLQEDATSLLDRLAQVHPLLAARCLIEGSAQARDASRSHIVHSLVTQIADDRVPARARVQVGDALARLGDPRPEVGVVTGTRGRTPLPDIGWCKVPEGASQTGDGKPVHLQTFWITRYPITNAQYAAFVQDDGYTERWRHCWSDSSWKWKGQRTGPQSYGGTYSLSNHPVVGVTWYEAIAYCRWLTERLHTAGTLSETLEIALPSEAQWHKAAQGPEGHAYPWGETPDPNRANVRETDVGTTSAVGCFPGGASHYGVHDLIGNVWEWTASPNERYRQAHMLRGGAFWSWAAEARSDLRDFNPGFASDGIGFRCVATLPNLA